MAKKLYGGIEAGGTKFVCAVGTGPENIVSETRFPTTTPAETIQEVCDFFTPYVSQLQGIGLGTFGPIDLDPASATYGFITTTPKPNWSNINILGMLHEKLSLPIQMDTDVASAGLGESKWGASKGIDSSLYLTIGTGIGGSYIYNGRPLRGLVSSEMGHIRIPHDLELDSFRGNCPYHRDCFEGLASGPAIQSRFGQRPETLPASHPFWDIEARYIAYALANFIFTFAPRKIILGGGIMQQDFLFGKIRADVRKLLNKYLNHAILLGEMHEYIVPPALGNRSGVLGAIVLIMDSLKLEKN